MTGNVLENGVFGVLSLAKRVAHRLKAHVARCNDVELGLLLVGLSEQVLAWSKPHFFHQVFHALLLGQSPCRKLWDALGHELVESLLHGPELSAASLVIEVWDSHHHCALRAHLNRGLVGHDVELDDSVELFLWKAFKDWLQAVESLVVLSFFVIRWLSRCSKALLLLLSTWRLGLLLLLLPQFAKVLLEIEVEVLDVAFIDNAHGAQKELGLEGLWFFLVPL